MKAYIKLYQLTVLVPFLLNLTYLLSKSLSITTWGPSALLTFGQPAKKLHCCKIVFLSVFGFCLFTWHSLGPSTLLARVAKKVALLLIRVLVFVDFLSSLDTLLVPKALRTSIKLTLVVTTLQRWLIYWKKPLPCYLWNLKISTCYLWNLKISTSCC